MTARTGLQKAARKLQQETKASYTACLSVLKKHKTEAEELKGKEPQRPFTECLLEVGRTYLSTERLE